jgi:guanyl-specific ribonuclease Sa
VSRVARRRAALIAALLAWGALVVGALDAGAHKRRRPRVAPPPVEVIDGSDRAAPLADAPLAHAPLADAPVWTPPVSVVDFGRLVHDGPVDIGPTLRRIAAGQRLARFPHDGAVFSNRERALPIRPPGFWREYVHPTPGARGPGPQRVIVGRDGSVYYTPDHYATFYPIPIKR